VSKGDGPPCADSPRHTQSGPIAKERDEHPTRVVTKARPNPRTVCVQGRRGPMAKRSPDSDRRARQSQRLGRTLRVLCLIQGRGHWNLNSLAAELGCSKKTVQRDLLALEAAGIPFYYDERRCCYKIRPDFQLPIIGDPAKQPPGDSATAPPSDIEGPFNADELAGAERGDIAHFNLAASSAFPEGAGMTPVPIAPPSLASTTPRRTGCRAPSRASIGSSPRLTTAR